MGAWRFYFEQSVLIIKVSVDQFFEETIELFLNLNFKKSH